MLTADQQRVKDLLRETITLLCKNGLHFQSEFQIDGLIGITLDRGDVFLVTLKETVHSGDVFVRDSKRKYPDDRSRCYEDKRRTDHRKNNVSVKSELSKDDFAHRKLEHLSVDSRQRKSSMQSRVETIAKPKNLMMLDEGNTVKDGDDMVQHSKGFRNESAENDLPTLDEGNNSGTEGCEQEKIKTGCFSDVGQEIGLLLDSEADEKKGFQRSLSTENPDDDNGEDSDYRRNDDDEDEAYRSRRDDEDDDNDGGGSIKTDFIRKTNSHKFLSPTISSAATNNMEDNDEEPLVVKVEPPDTSYNPYPSSSQRSDLDFDGDGWGSGQHHRGHSNASQPSSGRHYQNVNEVFNNSSTSFRNAAKPFIQNASKGQQMATSIFSDNLQLHQQMLNSRQQPQQQRNNNYNELFTSLVDITQNQGFPGDEFLAGGGDFLHVASQQFPPHQQMNRLLQRRQRSTFTRTQVKCLEDVFKTVHYVDASLRMKLSRQLNLSEGTINIWFQNRRQKLKKQQQQMMMTSNSSGVPNDESLMGGGDMNPGGANPLSGDFIVNQSPGRPSNSSFSGSNAGSSPAYMQSPIHNNPPSSSAHNVQFNPMDQCPNFAFNSEPGKT